jgi:hypothetical protein
LQHFARDSDIGLNHCARISRGTGSFERMDTARFCAASAGTVLGTLLLLALQLQFDAPAGLFA